MTGAILLAGALLCARPGDAAPQVIPVDNASLDEAEAGGNFPASWWSNRREDISLITDAAHGTKAVRVNCGWGWAKTDLNVALKKLPEGEEISIGWWIKLEDVKKGWNDGDICKLYVFFRTWSWQDTYIDLAKFEGKSGWKWMTKTKIKVPTNLMEARITLVFDNDSRGQIALDRIVVVKGTEFPPETISTAGEIGTAVDQARVAITRARTAAKRDTVEGSAGEALLDVRGRVAAVTLLADQLEAEARALAAKAEPRSNLLERAAETERTVALVRARIASAIALLDEGEAARRREPSRAKAEEVSAAKAAEALRLIREATEAADLAANAMTPALMILGTWGQGVWKSTDDDKWEATNATALRPYTSFITAAPDGRLYSGGNEATLLDSDDNGKTWSATPTRLPVPATGLALDPADPGRWLIATWGRGAFLSDDQGRNWRTVPSPSKLMRAARVLRAGPGSPWRIYSVADEERIVRTDSFGGEWTEVARMPRGIKAWDLAMKPTPKPVLLAATDAGVAEVGDDGKVSFPKLEVATAWARALATDLDRVLIGTYGGGIVEWKVNTTATPVTRRLNEGIGNGLVSALAASIHPKPAVIEDAGAVTGPRVWTERNEGLAGSWINGIGVNPADDKVMYCTSKSGFYRSTDRGATWVSSATGLIGLNLGHVLVNPWYPDNVFVSPAYLVNPAGVQKSADAGKNWTQKNKGLTAMNVTWIALDPNNPSTMALVTWGAGTFLSWDSGENWGKLSGTTQQNGYCVAFGPASPSAVLLGMAGQVYRLENWNTWKPSGTGIPGLDIWTLVQDPNDGKTWLAGTAGGGLYKTTDGAATWRRVTKGLTSVDIYRVAYHPGKKGVVYIGTKNSGTGRGGNGIFRSADGGESWAPDNEGLSALGIEGIIVTSKGLVYTATQNGVFYKQD